MTAGWHDSSQQLTGSRITRSLWSRCQAAHEEHKTFPASVGWTQVRGEDGKSMGTLAQPVLQEVVSGSLLQHKMNLLGMQLVKLLSAFYYQSLFCFKTKEKSLQKITFYCKRSSSPRNQEVSSYLCLSISCQCRACKISKVCLTLRSHQMGTMMVLIEIYRN